MADWLTHLALQGIGAPVFYPLGISPLKPAFSLHPLHTYPLCLYIVKAPDLKRAYQEQ